MLLRKIVRLRKTIIEERKQLGEMINLYGLQDPQVIRLANRLEKKNIQWQKLNNEVNKISCY